MEGSMNMEQYKKRWLEKEKERWRYAGLRFSETGYEIMDEKTYWNSEWFHLLHEEFLEYEHFYCLINEWGREKKYYVQFSYDGSSYQFEFVKKETGLLEWDVCIKENGDKLYHRMFRNIKNDSLVEVSKLVERMLSMVINMPKYRVRLATGQYRLREKQNVRLFELVDQIKKKG